MSSKLLSDLRAFGAPRLPLSMAATPSQTDMESFPPCAATERSRSRRNIVVRMILVHLGIHPISASGNRSVSIIPMTGPRPLMLCLWALLNTAFWAGIMHLIGLFVALPFGPVEWGALLIVIFVLSFIILLSAGIGRPNGGSPGREDG